MTQSDDFAKAIGFAWWPIFKMVSFLEYLVFFGAVFCTELLEITCRMDFDMFFGILIFDPKWRFCKGYRLCMMADFQNGLNSNLTQSDDFAKAIGFAWWPIFKMVSFLEYLVFFGAVFCTELLEITCRMDFDMCFGILIFDPKWRFCKGYRLCMMADFQNGLISRIFSVFWSGFLHRTTRNHL